MNAKASKPPKKAAKHPPEIGIGKLVRRAHMAFSRQFRTRLASYDVTFGEFIHLEKLWQEDGLNQTEISRRAGVETASSTAVLDLLERRGYVHRQRNGSDRRNINVFLRPEGAALKTKLLACAKSVNLVARAELTEREVLTFFELMEKIAKNLEREGTSALAAPSNNRRRQRKLDAE